MQDNNETIEKNENLLQAEREAGVTNMGKFLETHNARPSLNRGSAADKEVADIGDFRQKEAARKAAYAVAMLYGPGS